jgi:hypothetical protein
LVSPETILRCHGVLRSAIEAARSLAGDVAGELVMNGRTMPIAKFQGVPTPIKAMASHVEAMCCYAGQSVGEARRVQPAPEIMEEMLKRSALSWTSASTPRQFCLYVYSCGDRLGDAMPRLKAQDLCHRCPMEQHRQGRIEETPWDLECRRTPLLLAAPRSADGGRLTRRLRSLNIRATPP